jgi:hypothetical protein
MKSHSEMIRLWPKRGAFGADIGAKPAAVTNMIARDSVPSKYWSAMVAAAQERGIHGVTLSTLAAAASLKPRTRAKTKAAE